MRYLLQSVTALVCSMAVFACADSSTVTIPLEVVPIKGHDSKVGVLVSVAGGPPTQVTFDTGGEGLHIFASQVGKQNIIYTNQHIKSSFGGANGFDFEGVIAYAPVNIGGVATAKPVPILVIQDVQCHDGGTDCGFDMKSGAPPMFGHFYGELGAGMMGEHDPEALVELFSPLRDLPGNYGSGFIVKDLQQGGEGELIVGLTPENTSGFNKVQLEKLGTRPNGQPIFNDKGLIVDYTIGQFHQTWRTAFDTGGNANVNLFSGEVPGISVQEGKVRRGLNFEASLAPAFDWRFTTGAEEGVNLVRVLPLLGDRPAYVNTGLLFFFNYNVMYDFNNGVLGFQPQQD